MDYQAEADGVNLQFARDADKDRVRFCVGFVSQVMLPFKKSFKSFFCKGEYDRKNVVVLIVSTFNAHQPGKNILPFIGDIECWLFH